MKINYITTSTFGLEAVVKREVERLGGEDIKVSDGRIDFSGGIEMIPKCNMWLRSGDRLLINFAEFDAYTFDELFEKTKALPWENWITKDGKFTVTGKSIKSQLFSVSDCQAIVKKAIVERLRPKYNVDWFEETGPEYKVQVGLLKDRVTLTIDTTGPGLHKRGYRLDAVVAPLKETIASALIDLSYWKNNRILFDPMCGSGTIAIEAAMMARNIAPGLTRDFASKRWPQIDEKIWKDEKLKAYAEINVDVRPEIHASDMDPKAIETAKHNSRLAGVDDSIYFETRKFDSQTPSPGEYGVMISNPPYGERIGTIDEMREIHKNLGIFLKKNLTWSLYVITSNEEFEKQLGKKADKKRKLFNGNVKTDYYQYFGPRPPKSE